MAKDNTLLILGLGAVGYLWLTGKLGNVVSAITGPGQTVAASSTSAPPPAAPPSPVATPSKPVIPTPCDTSFIPGVRYVARTADGGFDVVVGGVLRRHFPAGQQSAAENYYNQLVCGG